MSPHRNSIVSLLAVVAIAWAATVPAAPLDGSFRAEERCPAYVSKNAKSNPGNASIEAGLSYPVLEVNDLKAPAWYRLRLDGVQPPERWVAAACGRLEGARGSGADQCHAAGMQQSHVLSLTWQPGFCASHRDKPECGRREPGAYGSHHFTLHGLWPNRDACGIDYGFCGSVKRPSKSFCNYPEVPLAAAVRAELGQVMPGTRSCLERHEWYKHGSCQTGTPDAYFSRAIDLVRQFNDAGIAQFMARRADGEVELRDLLAHIDQAFGDGASRRVRVNCNGGELVEVDITLPAELPPRKRLAELMQEAKEAGGVQHCGHRFRISGDGRR